MRPEVPEHFRRAATHLKSCQIVQMTPSFWYRLGIRTRHVFFANSDMTPEQDGTSPTVQCAGLLSGRILLQKLHCLESCGVPCLQWTKTPSYQLNSSPNGCVSLHGHHGKDKMEILPLFDAPRRLRKFFNCTLAQTSGASYHLGDVGALSEAEPESDLEDAGLTLSGDISRDLRICLQKARRMGDYHQSVTFQFHSISIHAIHQWHFGLWAFATGGSSWTSVFFLHPCMAIASICWQWYINAINRKGGRESSWLEMPTRRANR